MRHSSSDLAAKLRFVDIIDCDATAIEGLRTLRNDPQVRHYLYTTHEIGAAEHEKWVEMVSADDQRRVFAVFMGEEMAGSVNWSKRDMDTGAVSWGFYVNPQLAGRGIGTAMLERAIVMIFEDRTTNRLQGEAIIDNAASIALHKRLGFVEEGRRIVEVDGKRSEAVVFALQRPSRG